MIEVRNLTKKYGNTKVVDNVSLDINPLHPPINP